MRKKRVCLGRLDAQGCSHLLVDHVADTDCRRHLEEVGSNASIQSLWSVMLEYMLEDSSHGVF